jgi:recombination protein RecR
LAEAIRVLPEKIKYCSLCGNLTEEDPCYICSDTSRDNHLLCVVERPLDVISIEKTSAFNGLYHVLGGVLSPLDGVGPAELRIRELLERLKTLMVEEIILATNPSVEGEATANFLSETISSLGLEIRLTRFARGLPVGGELTYADQATLSVAIQSRKPI